MKTLKSMKAKMLSNPQTRAAHDALADEFAVARELIAARTRAGLTQADVAGRLAAPGRVGFRKRQQASEAHFPSAPETPAGL